MGTGELTAQPPPLYGDVVSEYKERAERDGYLRREWGVLNARREYSFYAPFSPIWNMDHAERAGLTMLLSLLKPKVALEVGTHFGGSASVLAHYSGEVYCIDTDPRIRQRCSMFGNVKPIVGASKVEAPRLLERLQREGRYIDFALVDGDHSAQGVRDDIDALISNRPPADLWVLMHDSFNPGCRRGIREASWDRPWVWRVEVDFIPGNLMPHPHLRGQMWGGFALAELRADDRPGSLTVNANSELLFQAALQSSKGSASAASRWLRKGRRAAKRLLGSR